MFRETIGEIKEQTSTLVKLLLFIDDMHSFFLLIFLLGSSCPSAEAQTVFPVIDLVSPDQKKIEVLTYEAVNKLRQEKKHPDLVWDEVLYRAAKDHADYLIKEEKISHFQTIKGKRTPAERVKIHGGLIYKTIGENVLSVTLGTMISVKGKKKSTITYEAAAKTMADAWKSSPGHYKNILSEHYNCTALAVAYDRKKQRLVAVQVFGFTSSQLKPSDLPDYSKGLLALPIPELPYRLKPYRYKKKNQKASRKFLSLHLDRGYLTGSYKEAKKIFRGRRSGISQEFIPLDQYDSTSIDFSQVANRRNGLFELNGALSKPVYRRQLLKYSRKHTFREYYIYTRFIKIKKPPTLFAYPLIPNAEDTEFNLFLVKSKRLENFKTYIKIPGKLFDIPFPNVQYVTGFKQAQENQTFIWKHTYSNADLKIFYTSGEVSIDSARYLKVTQLLDSIQGKIIAVEASAFASIEGDEYINNQLAKHRLKYFMPLLKPWMDTVMIEPQVKSLEQIDLFYDQVKGTSLDYLRQYEINKLREYVNQHAKDSLLSKLLDEQRYIQFKLVCRQDYKEYLPVKIPEQVYDSLLYEFNAKEKPTQELAGALEQAQLALYYQFSKADSLKKAPPFPDRERFPAYKYHDLIFRYTVKKNVEDKELYTQLHKLAASKYFPNRLRGQMIYNNEVLIFKNYLKGELNNLMEEDETRCMQYRQQEFQFVKFKKLDRFVIFPEAFYPIDYFIMKEIRNLISVGTREKVDSLPFDELWKYHYLYTIHSLYGSIPLNPRIYPLLPKFKQYFHPDDQLLTDEERLRLGYFYSALLKFNTAKKLVEPLATREEPNKEALQLYITLVHDDFEEEREFVDYLISQYPRLGKEEWCHLVVSPEHLNFLMFEDLKLKNFYNCNCPK